MRPVVLVRQIRLCGLGVVIGDPPDSLQLFAAVGVDELGRGLGNLVDLSAEVGTAAVHQQDRRRVERHLAHSICELGHLRGVHRFVGEDGIADAEQVEVADQAADRHAG